MASSAPGRFCESVAFFENGGRKKCESVAFFESRKLRTLVLLGFKYTLEFRCLGFRV